LTDANLNARSRMGDPRDFDKSIAQATGRDSDGDPLLLEKGFDLSHRGPEVDSGDHGAKPIFLQYEVQRERCIVMGNLCRQSRSFR
jgi:hypothetical protein